MSTVYGNSFKLDATLTNGAVTVYDYDLVKWLETHFYAGTFINDSNSSTNTVTGYDPEAQAGGAAKSYQNVTVGFCYNNSEDGANYKTLCSCDVTSSSSKGIDFSFGPFKVTVSVSLTDQSITGEFGIQIPIYGYVKLTNITGSLKTGITTGFHLFGVARGTVRLYKEGHGVWINVKADTIVTGTYEHTYKLPIYI